MRPPAWLLPLLLTAVAGRAAAQTGAPPTAASTKPIVADQELGVRIGVGLDALGIGPGGLDVVGLWLYRLTDTLWFDARASFLIGSGGAMCTFPENAPSSCGHAVATGAAFELLGGIRVFMPGTSKLVPWVGGGVGLGLVELSGDSVTGLGIPLWGAAGVRTRLTDLVAVGAEAHLTFGPVKYDRFIGWESFARLTLLAGVDFALP